MITAAARAANRDRQVLGAARPNCPLCGSFHLQYQILIDNFPVCACQTCGLAFLNPSPETLTNDLTPPHSYAKTLDNFDLLSQRVEELKAYSGIQNGSLLVIGDSDHFSSVARQQGFETLFQSIHDFNAGGILPRGLNACILHCALEKAKDPVALLQSVHESLLPNGAAMVISRVKGLHKEDRFYFSVDALQSLLVKTHFADPIIARTGPNPESTISFLVRPRAPSPPQKLLSVIVPVYNEKRTFSSMMDQLLEKTIDGLDIEIIVVESNSTDGSREEVMNYAHEPRVKIILEPEPLGKGHAVRAGLKIAQGDVILFQDADLEYDLNDYDALIAPILRFETNFVLGSRHNDSRTMWKMRRFTDSAALAAYFNLGHVLFLALFNAMYKQRLTDPFTMFKVFRRDCIYGLNFECNRFDFDNEIVIKLVRRGYKPLELPVNYVSRSFAEGKKVTLVGDALRWLRTLMKFRHTPLYAQKFQEQREAKRGEN